MNLNSRKTQKKITAVIIIILVIAMLVPMVMGALI